MQLKQQMKIGAHLSSPNRSFGEFSKETNLQVSELLQDPIRRLGPLLENPDGLGTEVVLVGGEG